MLKVLPSIFYMITASFTLAVIFQIKPDEFFYLRQNMLIEPWRFLTAHFVHVGWVHLALNMFALICLPYIFPKFNKIWFLSTIVILPIFISIVFYFFYIDVVAYAGFSGVLHGLYALGAIQTLRFPTERKFGLIILIGLISKLIWEKMLGEWSLTTQLIGSPVLVEAHQLGVLGIGLSVTAVYIFRKLTG